AMRETFSNCWKSSAIIVFSDLAWVLEGLPTVSWLVSRKVVNDQMISTAACECLMNLHLDGEVRAPKASPPFGTARMGVFGTVERGILDGTYRAQQIEQI